MRFSTRCGRLVAVLLSLVLLTSGCSAIPTSGPVGTITAQAEDGGLDMPLPYSPRGPSEGATPEEIVDGFIAAGRGVQEDYQVAREYLAPERAGSWKPEDRVLIYRAEPRTVQTPTTEKVQIQVEVLGSIDSLGIRSDTAEGTTETIDAKLTKDSDGQWRIAEVPDGILIPEGSVSTLFRSHSLYFYNSTYRYWVPDVRWFVKRQGVAANIIKTMLAGPAPYLEGAVVSAFPDGTTLPSNSVPVSSGEATVDLSGDILQDTTDERLRQMKRQLEQNLSGLNTVYSVGMSTGQVPVDIESVDTPEPVENPSVGITQVALLEDELTYYRGAQAVPIEGIASVKEYKPRDPAMSLDMEHMAFLNGERTQVLATAPELGVRSVGVGKGLTAPSFDPMNWLWTAGGTEDGRGSMVSAVPPGGGAGTAVDVSAEWLGDRVVKELRVSRDGARALIVAEQAGKSQLLLSGITRSADGVPRELGMPYEINAGGPVDSAKWVDETTMVVMARSADSPVSAQIIRLGAPPQETAPLNGMLNISAGTGEQDIFAQTSENIYSRIGNSWIQGTAGIKDPAFPG